MSSSCCGGHDKAATPQPVQVGQDNADDVATCPVMRGSTVVKADAEAAGLYRDHNGTRYWLCCSSCGPLFDADPERYVSAA
ncbi:hypothetical protein J4H86_21575 [Spiractinospora alimapuensis]|uniref:hypothetical protein n=1 Tax=Spiractinospora alimapuensis TaxID=2820884 RepID=UPI001F42ADCA|nr:hypothetical protein [Spiractinospora alimapuensis]QVQ51373.1 hypothetical protein J4H86_21575 [Spiractinospora alimapuensis]